MLDDEGDGLPSTSIEEPTLDADELKALRVQMGLSQVDLGKALRLGEAGARTVRRWEAGETLVPGPVSVAVEALASGWRPGDAGSDEALKAAHRELSGFLQALRESTERTENELQLLLQRTSNQKGE